MLENVINDMDGKQAIKEILEIWKNSTNSKKEKYLIFLPYIQKNKEKVVISFPIFREHKGKLFLTGWVRRSNQEKEKITKYDDEYVEIELEKSEKYLYNRKEYKNIINCSLEILKSITSQENENEDSAKGKYSSKIDDEYEKYVEEYKKLDQEIKSFYISAVNEYNSYLKRSVRPEKDIKSETSPNTSNSSSVKLTAKNGLRYVSYAALKVATILEKEGDIVLQYDKDGDVEMISNIDNLCQLDTEILYSSLVHGNKCINGKNIFKNQRDNVFHFLNKLEFGYVCPSCKNQKCPKKLAAYIHYLKQTNTLEEKLEDRRTYRASNETNDWFEYNLKTKNGVKEVPEKIYEFCTELVNERKIFLPTTLENDGTIRIFSKIGCSKFKVLNCDIEKLKQDKGLERSSSIRRKNNLSLEKCSTCLCGLENCPIEVAAYIYYLNKIGKRELLLQERDYYEQNKDAINKALLQRKEENIKKLKIKKESYTRDFSMYSIKNLEILIDNILNVSKTNFHCIVEGKDEVLKKSFINKIIRSLEKVGKIDSKNVKRISLINLAISSIQKSGEEVVYVPLPSNLYIVDGINEFINQYKTIDSYNLYVTLHGMRYRNVLDLIANLTEKNYIILDAEDEEIEKLFQLAPKLKFVYQNNIYKFEDISIDEMFDIFIDGIDNNLLENIRENRIEYKNKFEEYVIRNKNFIPLNNRELALYLAEYSNSRGKFELPENIYKEETIEERLNKIVGLDKVKQKMKEFEQYMLFTVKAKNKGLKLKDINLHMLFYGNPGTGKTTIARIMTKMLFDIGIIKEEKIIEVERKDLVGEYIGKTAVKTNAIINKAYGGVLFIDEAYSLNSPSENDFGKEAIATLIKAMEDQKGKFVVIFAGYKEEMKTFLEMNPGLKSRIGYTFEFEDYTIEQLMEIFYKKIEGSGFVVTDKAKEKIKEMFNQVIISDTLGNGRFVDRILQEIIMKHAQKASNEIDVISEEDILTKEELYNIMNNDDKKGDIGFRI